jgi:glycerate kinase
MAACAGLPLVDGRANPMLTTTYGVGQLIADAARRGCKKIILGLGGSATNDFGAGAAAALGVNFFNKDDENFTPTGGTLADVVNIDMSYMLQALKGVELVTMCDIDNPLYGKTGAAYIFGPQKGADAAMVEVLDKGLRAISKVAKRDLGVDVSELAGAGAAGGMGGGMVAFFGSQLKMGIDVVLDTVGFDKLLAGADLVLSGEGKIDSQSIRGKVVVGVARRAKRQNVPVVAVVGGIDDDVDAAAYAEGVEAIFSINRKPVDFAIAKTRSKENLRLTMDNLMRLVMRFC